MCVINEPGRFLCHGTRLPETSQTVTVPPPVVKVYAEHQVWFRPELAQ